MEKGKTATGIEEWYERFCNDPASVKSFQYTRTVRSFNVSPIRSVLTTYLRELNNYQGTITIKPFLAGSPITIYSPH